MRIIRCHIDNFGKLQNLDLNLEEGLNVIREDNGWGKSTLAAFLRAMFYGFEGARKRLSIRENERKLYHPWQGGSFGGSVTFGVNGRVYTASRKFGDSARYDTFELRDAATNLISNDYSERLGEELFRLDRNSFLNSIFIGQNSVEAAATDDINARIGNLSDQTNDLNAYESAIRSLTDGMNALKVNKSNGTISRRAEAIAELKKSIAEKNNTPLLLRGAEELLAREEEQNRELHREREAVEKLQARALSAERTRAYREREAALSDDLRKRREAVAETRAYFKEEIPSIPAVMDCLEVNRKLERAHENAAAYALSDEEKESLRLGEEIFAEGIPSDEELEELRSDIALYRKKRELNASSVITEREEDRLVYLLDRFAGDRLPASDVIIDRTNAKLCEEKLSEKKQRAERSAKEIETFFDGQKRFEDYGRDASRREIGRHLMIALGILAAVFGLIADRNGVMNAMLFTVGGALLAAGGLAIVLVTGIRRARYKSIRAKAEEYVQIMKEELEDLQSEILGDEEFIAAVSEQTSEYLKKHEKAGRPEDIEALLDEIQEEEFEMHVLEKKRRMSLAAPDLSEVLELGDSITMSLSAYDIDVDLDMGSDGYTAAFYQLTGAVATLRELKEKKRRWEKALEESAGCERVIAEFLSGFGLAPQENLLAQLLGLRDHIDEYEDACAEEKRAQNRLAQLRESAEAGAEPAAENEALPSLSEIGERLRTLTAAIDRSSENLRTARAELADLMKTHDEWTAQKEELALLEEQQRAEEKRYELLGLAKKGLTEAKEAMTARYAAPLRDHFLEYYTFLTGEEQGRIYLDANARVTVTEQGLQRETDMFSAGYRDLIGVCLRIAMADCMYPDEKPMLIFDDSFVNLDDAKVREGMRLLELVAERYQVLYLTCSEYRT